MQNFYVYFSNPWWLLLLIPAVALSLLPYFRLSKKYRRTRNRITSLVLHITIMVLAITVLAGMDFRYQKPNDTNEIMLVIDMSDSEEESAEARDTAVERIIEGGSQGGFKLGVVTFGYNQNYAVPLTSKVDEVYDRYKDAELPDVSATNVAAALTFARSKITHPETAKIVLVTDGKETDEEAISVIRKVVAGGVKLDTVSVPSLYDGEDLRITSVVYPEYRIGTMENFNLLVTVDSNFEGDATLTLYDNDFSGETLNVKVAEGLQTFSIPHTFETDGLHEVKVVIDPNNDLLEQNNSYTSYYFLQLYNKVLVLERADESETLKDILEEEQMFDVTVINVNDAEKMPKTAYDLRQYDQVVMNNVANDDMPEGFIEELAIYVRDFGGGMLTVGGSDGAGNANIYSTTQMMGTLYQQMLPVQVIEYTPPVGVVVIVDRSGSMTSGSNGGMTKLEWALAGAESCLDALEAKDYFGFMTLDSDYDMILPCTARTQEAKILEALASVDTATGSTVYPGAIERASQELIALKTVDKRHIILVTDGQVPSSQVEQYEALVKFYNENHGITLSVVGIGIEPGSQTAETMQRAVDLGHGRLHLTSDASTLVQDMREDLRAPDIQEVNPEPFKPTIYNELSPVVSGIERAVDENGNVTKKMTVELGGFYGSKVRDSESVDLVLVGDFEVPLFAQWKYGKGSVGSFMSDLNGEFSSDFIADDNGKLFVRNMVASLMPGENIRPSEIEILKFVEDNYTNSMSIDAGLKEGETLEGKIVQIIDGEEVETSLNKVVEIDDYDQVNCYVLNGYELSAANGKFTTCKFVIKSEGVYKIVLTKKDADGNEITTREFYKSFAYSEEYYITTEEENLAVQENLMLYAVRGRGSYYDTTDEDCDLWGIYDEFITAIDKVFDPVYLFMTLAIIMFLMDIAVRKFKFKWPHEIIREHREKKNQK